MDFLQHIVDKASTECGVGFGVLFAMNIGLAIGIKIVLNMWGTDRKNLLDTIIETQKNLLHASDNIEKIVMAVTSSRAPGDCD